MGSGLDHDRDWRRREVILTLEPPIELDTPRGRGWAIIFRDYGHDIDDLWTVVINDTGEIWTFRNPEVRAVANVTFGRRSA